MRLKYYLRGLGLGIIFTCVILMIFSNGNKSKDTSVVEDSNGIELTEAVGNDFDSNEEEEPSVTDESNNDENDSNSNDENDSNSNDEIQSLDENINKPIDDQTVNEITGDSGELESEYVSLVIEQGDIARNVAEKLYEDGIINDVEAFRKYLGETGVSHTLHAGEYQIKVGATFEEIVEALK